MTITAKPQNKKTKNKTLKIRFGLASKDVFLVFLVFFWFFWFWNAKTKINLSFFDFFEGLWLEKITENKKTQCFVWCLHFKTKNKQKNKETTKKTSFEAKPSSLFKVCFFVLRSCGSCHSLHITSFQIYQDNKQGLYCLCVCVSYIYIYMYVCLEGHDTRGFEVYLRGGTIYIHIYIYIVTKIVENQNCPTRYMI